MPELHLVIHVNRDERQIGIEILSDTTEWPGFAKLIRDIIIIGLNHPEIPQHYGTPHDVQ